MRMLKRVLRYSLPALFAAFPVSGLADAITDGYARITGMSITPAGGTVTFDLWSSTSSAHAFDSYSLSADDFWSDLETDTSANASTLYAVSSAAATFSSFSLEASGSTSLLNPVVGLAEADSLALFDNFFSIGGGSGTVEVAFTLTYEMHLFGSADALGFFEQTAYVGLYVTDFVTDNYLDRLETISGSSLTTDETFSGTLTQTFSLAYDTLYFISLTADNQHSSHNEAPIPEPATFILLGTALAVFSGVHRRAFRHSL